MSNTSTPKGTRDFGAIEMLRRNYIFDTIKEVFRKYGYLQIETPAQELLSTLLGKYGDEGDRLLFRILNSGDFLSKVEDEELEKRDLANITKKIAEKGLRYDLTVPFARYVVQHRNEIQLPFKRFQIQPVWRADRPQKGRYREFVQCDADAVGTDALLLEMELVEMSEEVFRKLGIRVAFLVNNRKILAGIAEVIGTPERLTELTVAMDKLDKIGEKGVKDELSSRGFSESEIVLFEPFLRMESQNNETILATLSQLLSSSAVGMEGVEELRTILALLPPDNEEMKVIVSPSLARGLSYYTGTIMEIKALDATIGSISGGGRYDNLTGIFGVKGLSGVGISYGADRIYDVMEQLNLFPPALNSTTEILVVNFGMEEIKALLPLVRSLRKNGRKVIVYPDAAKMKKQLSYADALRIPYVIMAGTEELKMGSVTLKDMNTGDQDEVPQERLLELFPSKER